MFYTIYTFKIPIKGLDIKPVRHMKTKYDTRLTDIFLALGYGDRTFFSMPLLLAANFNDFRIVSRKAKIFRGLRGLYQTNSNGMFVYR